MEFPWIREEIQGRLKEMSDLEYQRRVWGHGDPNILSGVAGNFDGLIEDRNLDNVANGWIGYCLYENEVAALEKFAQKFVEVVHDLQDIYNNEAAISHKDWPEVVRLARLALDKMQENDRLHVAETDS